MAFLADLPDIAAALEASLARLPGMAAVEAEEVLEPDLKVVVPVAAEEV